MTTCTIVPPIKCQGIKTKLISWISEVAPTNFEGRWVEPFAGSCAVGFNLSPRRALFADSNPHIINFYNGIVAGDITPDVAREHLVKEGAELKRTEGEHYYVIRDRFNTNASPLDFLFLNRACFNGLMRFNRRGGFNVPFCRKPERFAKAYITKICNQIKAVATACNSGDYQFKCQDYKTTISDSNEDDLIYCDPPYIGRHADYYNDWRESHEVYLANALKSSGARFILSSWHGNAYRTNPILSKTWGNYNILTKHHFYHVGAKEKNRNSMTEALVTNYSIVADEDVASRDSFGGETHISQHITPSVG